MYMTNQKSEDLAFYTSINVEGFVIENVRCLAYLPLKMTDPLKLHFKLSEEQSKSLLGAPVWKFSIKGEVKDSDGITRKSIESNKVYSGGVVTAHSYGNFNESYIDGEPEDLTITLSLERHSNAGKVEGSFWITPNSLIESQSMLTESETGEKKLKFIWTFELDATNNSHLIFEKNEKRYKNQDGDTVIFYELVAGFGLEGETNENSKISETLEKLEDVLLLVSFVSRHRCMCLGLDLYDSKSFITKYFRNRTLPDDKEVKPGRFDAIIDLNVFDSFMKTAYPKLIQHSNLPAFRRTINFVIPRTRATVDGNFISLFTALEMLVLQFRNDAGLKYIFRGNQFEKKIKRGITEYIDDLELPEEDLHKKDLIKEKISELNRVSFATAFEQFCSHYSIDVSDLWSVIDSDNGISLYQIRNKLVHGEHFDSRHYTALHYAREHLRWTIERMVLVILGWDVEKSYISPKKLTRWTAYKNWQKEQEIFLQKE